MKEKIKKEKDQYKFDLQTKKDENNMKVRKIIYNLLGCDIFNN